MEFSLILLRGLPGSGKSSLAKVLAHPGFPVFSVDDYFTDPNNGAYEFRFAENHLAYKKCAQNCEEAMKNKQTKIFVDNTFTLEWEMDPYFELAKKYGYKLFVVTVENRHGGGNIHHISDEHVKRMAEKYQVKLI